MLPESAFDEHRCIKPGRASSGLLALSHQLCQAIMDKHNEHFRTIAPGRFPDAKSCGGVCRECIRRAEAALHA